MKIAIVGLCRWLCSMMLDSAFGNYVYLFFINSILMNLKSSVVVVSGIMRLDARARQDFAILGSEFLKLDGKLFG